MKITKSFTCILIIILNFTMFNTAHASALGSWSLSNPVSQGASVVYQGTRNALINGANKVITGSATIAPVAADVAKFIGRVGAAAVVTTVLDGLLNGADYVLDPANNTIRYKDKNASSTYSKPGVANFCDYAISGAGYPSDSARVCSFESAGTNSSGAPCVKATSVVNPWGLVSGTVCSADITSNSEQKSIPLPQLTQQIQDKAKAGDANAQALMRAVAADIVQDAEIDDTKAKPIINQLDNTATYPSDTTADTKTDTKTNADGTTTATSTTDIPAACDWWPSACEFFQRANKEMDDDPTYDTDTLDQSSPVAPDLKENAISFGNQCPAPQLIQFDLMGQHANIQLPWTPVCSLLSYLYYPIIASAYIAAAYIVVGAKNS